jgi:hypothetical protein
MGINDFRSLASKWEQRESEVRPSFRVLTKKNFIKNSVFELCFKIQLLCLTSCRYQGASRG